MNCSDVNLHFKDKNKLDRIQRGNGEYQKSALHESTPKLLSFEWSNTWASSADL